MAIRIAVSADSDNGLDSVISPHFGRCPFFALVDLEGQEVQAVEVIQNPYYSQHRPGQVPGFIHGQGVNVMLTGGMGGRAIQFFADYGIEAATGAAGTVRMALERYLGGELSGAAPCRESTDHGHGESVSGDTDASEETYEKDEVGRLREETEMLKAQLDQAMARLNKMRK
jgi:predicted Fe-Mo cluster-binding NifX family protein